MQGVSSSRVTRGTPSSSTWSTASRAAITFPRLSHTCSTNSILSGMTSPEGEEKSSKSPCQILQNHQRRGPSHGHAHPDLYVGAERWNPCGVAGSLEPPRFELLTVFWWGYGEGDLSNSFVGAFDLGAVILLNDQPGIRRNIAQLLWNRDLLGRFAGIESIAYMVSDDAAAGEREDGTHCCNTPRYGREIDLFIASSTFRDCRNQMFICYGSKMQYMRPGVVMELSNPC